MGKKSLSAEERRKFQKSFECWLKKMERKLEEEQREKAQIPEDCRDSPAAG